MTPIAARELQLELQKFIDREVYLHLETTNGAYAGEGLTGPKRMNVGAFIRNARVCFHRAVVAGEGPYRIGLQMQHGWIYAEGLTHWEVDEQDRLLTAGFNEGRLAVALEISNTPFPM